MIHFESPESVSLLDKAEIFVGKKEEKIAYTAISTLLVGVPAAGGGLAGMAVGYLAAAAEVVHKLASYGNLQEAVESASTWTSAASLTTGAIGAALGARHALRNDAVREILGMKALTPEA